MEKKCCICGHTFTERPNNAEPVRKGVCCNSCNMRFVIQGRATPGISSYEIVKNPKEWKELKSKLEERDFEHISHYSHNGEIQCFKHPETEEKVLVFAV